MLDDNVQERFWPKVNKDGPTMAHMQTPCWVWIGSKKNTGYGQLIMKTGKPMLAHRLSYMFANGNIPSNLHVCHHCDNPSCVRPDHLFLGTQKDNSQDMVRKGRGRRLPPEVRAEREATSRKKHYEENRERLLAEQKEYREKNRERERERKRVWYEQNRDRVRIQQKEYHERTATPKVDKRVLRSLRLPADLYAVIEQTFGEDVKINEAIVELIRRGLDAA